MLQGLAPLLNEDTRLIILGSFPSVRSLQSQQYYAHPQNQLWKLIFTALLADSPSIYCSSSYEIRSDKLRELRIGLWDVYASCEREGSLDSAINNAQLNDLASLRQRCPPSESCAPGGIFL